MVQKSRKYPEYLGIAGRATKRPASETTRPTLHEEPIRGVVGLLVNKFHLIFLLTQSGKYVIFIEPKWKR